MSRWGFAVDSLLKTGNVNINQADTIQRTFLHYAVDGYFLEIVQLLCRTYRANVNAYEDFSRMTLHLAAGKRELLIDLTII